MYRLATIHSVTDGQTDRLTDDIMMPIVRWYFRSIQQRNRNISETLFRPSTRLAGIFDQAQRRNLGRGGG